MGWRDYIARQGTAGLVEKVEKETRPDPHIPHIPLIPPEGSSNAEGAELRRLVNLVADSNAFTREERDEALTRALADPEPALTCFRALDAKLD